MDIFVVLTGRKGHGKDSVADIAIKEFGCAGKVALANWFKETLAQEFKIPLEKFFDTQQKDAEFEKPIVVQRRNLRNLLLKIGEYGFMNVNKISTMRWEGRQLRSIREMMLWFGHEVVTKSCGDVFHCKVTEERKIPLIPRKPNHANIIFITDARQYVQSKYFMDKYKYVFPVLVSRPNGSGDDHPVEKAVDEFPESYFFAKIENDGSLGDLNDKVRQLLLLIKKAVTGEAEVSVPQPATKKKTKTKKEINNEAIEPQQEDK